MLTLHVHRIAISSLVKSHTPPPAQHPPARHPLEVAVVHSITAMATVESVLDFSNQTTYLASWKRKIGWKFRLVIHSLAFFIFFVVFGVVMYIPPIRLINYLICTYLSPSETPKTFSPILTGHQPLIPLPCSMGLHPLPISLIWYDLKLCLSFVFFLVLSIRAV